MRTLRSVLGQKINTEIHDKLKVNNIVEELLHIEEKSACRQNE